jgi:hypothetical protein
VSCGPLLRRPSPNSFRRVGEGTAGLGTLLAPAVRKPARPIGFGGKVIPFPVEFGDVFCELPVPQSLHDAIALARGSERRHRLPAGQVVRSSPVPAALHLESWLEKIAE